MWIHRDFLDYIASLKALPIKVLKGPRQVGKTSLLEKLGKYKTIYFDDHATRRLAQDNPRLFFDQIKGPHILDEATLAPEIFFELKRRVDESRRLKKEGEIDYWITGSNQTLLQKSVSESLVGRANYFDLNTLSIHEIKDFKLSELLLRGGWPELIINPTLSHTRYLNDLVNTFIERDILSAAGIEKKNAFSKTLHLVAGRVCELMNYSDIGKSVGAETQTIQSWIALLAQNGLITRIPCFASNLNQRLIKTPKYIFNDVSLAARLQGWTEFNPLYVSPSFGKLLENLAISEVVKFFFNKGEIPKIYYVRSKEKVEFDLLIELPNNQYIAAEVKSSAADWTPEQMKLLASLKLNIAEKWVISPTASLKLKNSDVVTFDRIWDRLSKYI